MKDLKALRKKICAERAKLSADFQQQAANKVAEELKQTKIFTDSNHIAFYLAVNGEMDVAPLMQFAWELGKSCYLPIVNKDSTLSFALYNEGDPLFKNIYDIPEPYVKEDTLIRAKDLDTVIMPLVGFDLDGNRLGMGGGYYDRTFAFVKDNTKKQPPCLIGVAYEFQNISHFDQESWDVPLDMIATEIQLRDLTGRNRKD